jgi:hypothetical protein
MVSKETTSSQWSQKNPSLSVVSIYSIRNQAHLTGMHIFYSISYFCPCSKIMKTIVRIVFTASKQIYFMVAMGIIVAI